MTKEKFLQLYPNYVEIPLGQAKNHCEEKFTRLKPICRVKNLNKPNISSFTKHRRRTERTIFGNEEHETREVKTYKLRPQLNEYGQIIGTSKIPYDEEGEEEYIEGEEEYNDEGEGEEQEGEENEEDMEEEAYYQ